MVKGPRRPIRASREDVLEGRAYLTIPSLRDGGTRIKGHDDDAKLQSRENRSIASKLCDVVASRQSAKVPKHNKKHMAAMAQFGTERPLATAGIWQAYFCNSSPLFDAWRRLLDFRHLLLDGGNQ